MSENEKHERPRPVLFGCAGARLTSAERSFFREADPFGFIFFKRNCEDREQLHYLILELKQAVGRDDIVIAIDQEGGKVVRLQPPEWPQVPSARTFGKMYERDPEWGIEAIQSCARMVAGELTRLGILINCAPVVDLFNAEGTPALGDRAYSSQPAVVAALARAYAETFLAHGVLPVMKHLPGHGQLVVDPHHMLPTISTRRSELEAQDFMPFELLKDLPLGMNSHAVFTALDPHFPASLSTLVINDIIRGVLGFDGLLLSDDLTMKALSGPPGELALRALDAGNDIILHCSGNMREMAEMAKVLPGMGDASWKRWQHALSMVAPVNPDYNSAEDMSRLDVLLGGLAAAE